ncbi:MAG TPA: contact-dependent growth inhibition system immunity protein [Jatrophihabitans sp.]|nr:contact-dependent growth inhibition system immunity protein [Jatrophihabitans sp.]
MTRNLGLDLRYPALWTFFAGYMYQCWHDEFSDEWALADAFVHDEPLSASNFHAEMDDLLTCFPDEGQLRDILLDDFGAAAMVENRGWKYRDWLQALSDHVARAAGHPQAS